MENTALLIWWAIATSQPTATIVIAPAVWWSIVICQPVFFVLGFVLLIYLPKCAKKCFNYEDLECHPDVYFGSKQLSFGYSYGTILVIHRTYKGECEL